MVEMFVDSLSIGLLAFAASAMCFLWAILTRVRRRAVAAACIAVGSSVLFVFAAAAGGAPDSAFFWILAIGIGFAVMLVAAIVEAYRTRKGRVMARLSELTDGWE